MSVKTLFSIAAVLTLLLGVSWMLFPATMLSAWNVPAGGITVYMSRRYAGMFLGYSAILWLSRSAPSSPTVTAITIGGFVASGVMAVLSFIGVVTGTIGPAAWGAVVIEGLLACGFGYSGLPSSRGKA